VPTEQFITLTISIIMCGIGISTFISSLLNRARNDGSLTAKLEEVVKGIEDIKSELKDFTDWKDHINQVIVEHSEKIETLFRNVTRIEHQLEG
jgi:hypothetical protein